MMDRTATPVHPQQNMMASVSWPNTEARHGGSSPTLFTHVPSYSRYDVAAESRKRDRAGAMGSPQWDFSDDPAPAPAAKGYEQPQLPLG